MSKQVYQLVTSIPLDDGGSLIRVLDTFGTREGAMARRRAILIKARAAELRHARSWLTKARRGLAAHPDSPTRRAFFERKRAVMLDPKLGPMQKVKAEGEAAGIAWNEADFAQELRDAQAYLARLSDLAAYIRSQREPRVVAKILKD